MRSWALGVIAALAACGRLGFDPAGGGDAAIAVGDEAYELVINRGVVYLAILLPGALELLEPCQG